MYISRKQLIGVGYIYMGITFTRCCKIHRANPTHTFITSRTSYPITPRYFLYNCSICFIRTFFIRFMVSLQKLLHVFFRVLINIFPLHKIFAIPLVSFLSTQQTETKSTDRAWEIPLSVDS